MNEDLRTLDLDLASAGFLDRCMADLAGLPEQRTLLAVAGSPCSGRPAPGRVPGRLGRLVESQP